ncbi:Arylsulfatase [Rubinisphaera italica]|uniref:Arylsulfatase n=2 Tax=Rubinisphaera italica TaxID=2527969 RepID=A0A5C5XNW6_9PLAN|nr:sulfatase-like hydrolase/transferase [Rubinisphaera italica]TWT63462.1 Arylsulfatase [Rubinisphaera italica]
MYRSSCAAILFVIGMSAQAYSQGNNENSSKPNILLIVSDDQGYNDLGVLNNDLITPALDRIARSGTRLTNFYVTWPACTPSRSGLLTGRYPQRNGVYDMIRNEAPDYGYKYKPGEYDATFERIGGMDQQEIIIPALLQKSGYASAIYGKWDLGSLKRYLPTSRGFDDFYGFVNTGIDYYTHERYGVPSMFHNLEPTEDDKGTYCTYLFEREALKFLDRVSEEQPFFLYLPFNAPHSSSALEPEIRSSVQAPEEFKQMYPPVEEEVKPTNSYRYGNPALVTTQKARQRDYRAAVTCMDASIGKVLDKLEQQGKLDNTIVIFFSDNGGSGGADNSPLRGHKSQMWEGGVRVPCIISWPDGDIPMAEVNDEFLTSLELLPSLAIATGTSIPADLTLDGFNWWPTLRNATSSPRQEMFWKRRNQIAARVGDYKWVVQSDNQGGLYNLANDLSEKNDLSETHPELLKQIQQRYQRWLEEMEAAEPRGPFRDY